MQQPEQQQAQRVYGRPFKGSGNPRGVTARQRHAAALTAKDAGNDNCYDFGFRGMTE
jgi:hypothetical protein